MTVFQRNFDAWDKDNNGLLTPAEVDGAIADAKLSGEDAAAAATLKCVSRDNLYRVRRLDVATIKDDLRIIKPENRSAVVSDELFTPDWQRSFEIVLKRGAANRAGAASPSPNIDNLAINGVGSVAFVAVLGGILLQRPELARGMVSAGAEAGTWKVVTPLWTKEFGPITEAQALACSTSGDAWARVIECGTDSLRTERFPQLTYNGKVANFDDRFICVQDYIRLLSGKQSTTTYFRKPSGTRSRTGWGYNPVGSPSGLASTVLQNLAPALAKKRIAFALTDNVTMIAGGANRPESMGPLPPGIPSFATITITSIDAKAKTITLWGLGSSEFTPKGGASLTNGYPTSKGMWTMPLTDFVQVFAGFVVEGENPAVLPGQTRGKK